MPVDKSGMDVFVARQPILDRGLSVYGYELLYRSSGLNSYTATDETIASLQVLGNYFFTFDIAGVVGKSLAFINFTRDLLLKGTAEMAPARSMVVEVLENVPGDSEVLSACRQLRDQGYLIAADDICRADQNEALLDQVDFIKVDFQLASPAEQEKIVRKYAPRGVQMLAEKLETLAEFERARELGYGLFQGYFFAQPVVIKRKEISGFKLNYLRILNEIQRPEIEFHRLEQLIRQELSVAYKLLRYANSALFGQRTRVDSIHRALVILGEAEIRKWVSIVLLMHLAVDKPSVLVMQSLIRAGFCESLAQLSGLGARKSEMFLMGMFSLLDAMIDRSLPEALNEIHLAPDLRETLLAETPATSHIGTIYSLMLAHEHGDWPQVIACAGRLRLQPDEIRGAYLLAVHWCDQVFGAFPQAPSASGAGDLAAVEFPSLL